LSADDEHGGWVKGIMPGSVLKFFLGESEHQPESLDYEEKSVCA
jgi:hypothetical protein